MNAEQTISLVQRKARTGRDAQAARAMSLARALRLTAAKQAEQMFGLALGVLGVTRKPVGVEDLGGCLNAEELILLMDGPGGQVAAVVLDAALVAGLIQQQTMGRVTPPALQGDTARRHTATDAALCAPFVETLLARAALLPEEQAERDLLAGYRFGVWATDPRQALLALEAAAFDVVEMTLDMAAGVRSGKLTLVIPEPVRAVAEAGSDPAEVQRSHTTLADNVLGLHAELTIALTRVKLPLKQVSGLKPGDLLDINLSSMAQALVLDANGRAISRGTLGQINGIRAVQVEQQKTRQQSEPRRRAADRADLDLPDVTQPVAAQTDRRAQPDAPAADIPRLSDVDIFGNLDDLPQLPEMDDATQAADARFALNDEAREDSMKKQAGW